MNAIESLVSHSTFAVGIAVLLTVFIVIWTLDRRRRRPAEFEDFNRKRQGVGEVDGCTGEYIADMDMRPSPGQIHAVAILKERSHLRRLLEVETSEGIYFVEYNGNGLGYESVYVNGREAVKSVSMLWFVPRLEFRLGRLPCAIEVRIWPWLGFRYFALEVDGVIAYEE